MAHVRPRRYLGGRPQLLFLCLPGWPPTTPSNRWPVPSTAPVPLPMVIPSVPVSVRLPAVGAMPVFVIVILLPLGVTDIPAPATRVRAPTKLFSEETPE